MIGFHFQGTVQNWPNAVKLLPAGTWCKSLFDQHLCRDIKAVNPGVKTVLRHEFNRHQNLQGNYHDLARDYFSRFIDGTFFEQQLYKWIDGVEEWNEYLANSQSPSERANWLAWCKAVNEVWTNEYRYNPAFGGKLSHIRLVSCNTAVGNDIPIEFARVVQQHDGILSYHNYTNVYNKQVVASDWQYYSGRWAAMDAQYKAAGVTVKWLFTEGGPTIMGTFDGQHYAGVTEGWHHPKDYNGDIDAYVNGAIQYQLEKITAWNKANGNRCLGGVLFTSEANTGSIWKDFQIFESEMVKIAQKVATYQLPIEPPTPPPPEPETRSWNKLVVLVPQNITLAQYVQVCQNDGFPTRTEIAFSADSAFAKAQNAMEHTVVVYNVEAWGGKAALEAWVAKHYNHSVKIVYKTLQV